jgi:hypothetical protein
MPPPLVGPALIENRIQHLTNRCKRAVRLPLFLHTGSISLKIDQWPARIETVFRKSTQTLINLAGDKIEGTTIRMGDTQLISLDLAGCQS